MLDFASPDSECQGTKGSMGGCMRIPAYDGRSRKREPLFGADDVNHTLSDVIHAEVGNAEVTAVFLKGLNLLRADEIGNRQFPIGRGDIVIRHRERGGGTAWAPAGKLQPLKGLRRCDFMHELPVDVQKSGPIRFLSNNMRLPNFVEQCLARHQCSCWIKVRPHYTEKAHGLDKVSLPLALHRMS